MKLALCGMRHEHAKNIVTLIRRTAGMQLVAVCQEDVDSCRSLVESSEVTVTHAKLEDMLNDVDFDVLVLADVFAKRGAHAIMGLQAKKHILSDKPLCTSLGEFETIESEVKKGKCAVMLMLPLRYRSIWHTAKAAIQEGAIGEIITISVFGRHALKRTSGRPAWYFEKDKHGGTINDLFIHGIDGLEWATGQEIIEVIAARAWNQQVKDVPHFQDAAQAMLKMAGGAGVIMDASYTAPEGHKEPWMAHFGGSAGDMYLNTASGIRLRRHGEAERTLELVATADRNILTDLSAEIEGTPSEGRLSTSACMRATKLSLLIQQAADKSLKNVSLGSKHPEPGNQRD